MVLMQRPLSVLFFFLLVVDCQFLFSYLYDFVYSMDIYWYVNRNAYLVLVLQKKGPYTSLCWKKAKNIFLTNGSKLIMVAKRRQQVIEILKKWNNHYCNFYYLFIYIFIYLLFNCTKHNFLIFINFCQMLFFFCIEMTTFSSEI